MGANLLKTLILLCAITFAAGCASKPKPEQKDDRKLGEWLGDQWHDFEDRVEEIW